MEGRGGDEDEKSGGGCRRAVGEKQETEAAMGERIQLLGLCHGPGLWILDPAAQVDVQEAKEASRAPYGKQLAQRCGGYELCYRTRTVCMKGGC